MNRPLLHHVTLTTGHVRESDRSEIAAHVLEPLKDLVLRITSGAIAPSVSLAKYAPGIGPYSLSGRAEGCCLVATVWADGPPSVCIATLGISAGPDSGAALWKNLHLWGTGPVVTDPARCPSAPWVAAALELVALEHPDALEWLGDFERCLGWAWIGMQEDTP